MSNPFMEDLLRDVALAARALLRAPLLLMTGIVTLAIGIGLATGVFAVVYGALLRPLPYADPSRLVIISIHRADDADAEMGVPLAQVQEWRARVRTLERLASYTRAEFTFRGAGDPRTVRGAMVTDGFFELLGVAASEGSTHAIQGRTPATALSRRLTEQIGRAGTWRERGLSIGSQHFSAAAVMPPAFTFPAEEVELWLPAEAVPPIALIGTEDQRRFRLVGRLAPGITLAQAQDDATRVAEELNQGLTAPRRRYATVRLLEEHLRGDVRTAVLPFAAGAALVLLIACANVSGLFVGRAAARQREFALRRALGAGPGQLLRASLTESFVMAICGWGLGVWLAHQVARGVTAFGAASIPNLEAVRIDLPVVMASLALASLVAILSGGAPALRALRSDAGAVLKQSSDRIGRSRGGARGVLVVAQIALTVVLMVCAGLLMRTVVDLVSAERGFDQHNAVAMRLRLAETIRYQATDRTPVLDRLLSDVRALPGVTAAGVGSDLPPNGTQLEMTIRVVMGGRDEIFPLSFSVATPGYLQAIGATLVGGRFFEEHDRAASPPPAVISESASRQLFGKRDPIGQEWPATIPGPDGVRVKPRIIGLIKDVKYRGLDRTAPASLIAPWAFLAPSQAYLVVRTTGDPQSLSPALRRAVQQLDPAMPLFTPKSLEAVIDESIADRRLRLRLAIVFAALALVLASVALWGAVAQSVLDRRRELAIRLALGSSDAGAVRLMLRTGVVLILCGVAVGAPGAAMAARTLRHLLHGVAPFDPLSFAVGISLAVVVSFLACYLPARRAASISPAELLREG
ncbi:MAG TPA: ADOP family duplicated permease [Vicinamibacterales bacterium]|nr:ADOP family duplicated permease [Vicinamibacterales bacterium]